MNVYYDIELVFNWVKENFILKHSVSLVNSPWYDYDIEIDLRLVKQALLNGNFEFLYVVRDHGTMLLLLSDFHSSRSLDWDGSERFEYYHCQIISKQSMKLSKKEACELLDRGPLLNSFSAGSKNSYLNEILEFVNNKGFNYSQAKSLFDCKRIGDELNLPSMSNFIARVEKHILHMN
ncbi:MULTISPECIES: hypothetical protein [Klebsiella]|uniref:hypothetical protein n=1 Tax=Klebsiella TaxID=570 RepID=UPI0004E33889|nr:MULTISPECIES: hypothetical protein [Klebsiella]KFC35828.1 hypothetical protein FF19_21940 [Klebsiella michiganensis]MBA6167793.1 hypothetical protein [Klebsiella variicola]MBA6183481.1 hypothetical protein [Klebsiella variicola]UWX16640.1 hypothetical protein NHF44_26715 [Klebsiella pneumoniae]UWX22031.1 hypothetical protein NHF42_26895 [Klebsiella pneumoniae]